MRTVCCYCALTPTTHIDFPCRFNEIKSVSIFPSQQKDFQTGEPSQRLHVENCAPCVHPCVHWIIRVQEESILQFPRREQPRQWPNSFFECRKNVSFAIKSDPSITFVFYRPLPNMRKTASIEWYLHCIMKTTQTYSNLWSLLPSPESLPLSISPPLPTSCCLSS